MLVIDELSYRIGGRMVLYRVSAAIPPPARVALVGRNGAGQTTLLRLLLCESPPDRPSGGGGPTGRRSIRPFGRRVPSACQAPAAAWWCQGYRSGRSRSAGARARCH